MHTRLPPPHAGTLSTSTPATPSVARGLAPNGQPRKVPMTALQSSPAPASTIGAGIHAVYDKSGQLAESVRQLAGKYVGGSTGGNAAVGGSGRYGMNW
jgi:hypothetical protein